MSARANPMSVYDQAQRAAEQIRSRTQTKPSIAVVLGSGLGAFADELTEATAIAYSEIPGFAKATVEGHAGKMVIGKAGEVPIAAMQGRFHFYEGYAMDDVTFPVRVLKLLGVETVILTNAAGSLNTEFTPGSLMVISDHINLLGVNPLAGPNEDEFGGRFPDMTVAYDKNFRELTLAEGRSIG